MAPSPEKKDFTCYMHEDVVRDQKTMLGDIGYVKGKVDSVEDAIMDARRESIKQFRVLRAVGNGNHAEAAELEEENTQEIDLPVSARDKKLAARVNKLERWKWMLVGGGGAILYIILNLKTIIESFKYLVGQ